MAFKKNNYRYKLLLINPRQDFMHYGTQQEMVKLLGKKVAYTSLGLPIIAALTPEHYNIRIIDEIIESIPEDFKPDIVGISTYLASSERAFMLADKYMKMGIPVILGGPYTTYRQQEGMKHATSIVVGEAEGLWEKCLEDFESGKLKKVYSTENGFDFKRNVIPRWDLIDTSKIMSVGVQTRRGCPYKCEFCLVSKMFGRKVRYRDIDNVVEELKSLPTKKVIFVDDNFIINKKYTFELLRQIKPLGLSWLCQASIDVAHDEKLLEAMADAGCNYIVLGFESVNPESINETNKIQNTTIEYKEVIHKIHKAGIIAYASFIVGFDHDTLDEFDNIFKFSLEAELPYVMVSLLGVAPGTELFDRMDKAGRFVETNKEYSGGMFPVLHYNNMSQKDLFQKYVGTLEKLYDYQWICERSLNLLKHGYFTRENIGDPPSFLLKLKTSLLIINEYVLSKNEAKRKLFKEVWKLVQQKKLSTDAAAPFLLSMIGYNNQIRKIRANMDKYISAIESVDQGPWKNIESTQSEKVMI